MIEALSQISDAVMVAMVIVGLALCFFGYRLFKWFLGVLGFIIGSFAGVIGSIYVATDSGSDPNTAAIIISAIIFGIIGSAIAESVYFIGVFLIAGVPTAVIVYAMVDASGGPALASGIILGIIVGVIACFIKKIVIVGSTAFSGSYAVAIGITWFGNNNNHIGFWVFLFMLGLAFQIFDLLYLDKYLKKFFPTDEEVPKQPPQQTEQNVQQPAFVTCECGFVHIGLKFCTQCGRKTPPFVSPPVAQPTEVVESTPVVPVIPTNIICECGMENEAGSKFCVQCGTRILMVDATTQA